MPQSTAQTTRSTRGCPIHRGYSATCATQVWKNSAKATPRNRPCGEGRPTGLFRGQSQDCGVARLILEQGEPERDGILAGGVRELVDEGFERIGGMA